MCAASNGIVTRFCQRCILEEHEGARRGGISLAFLDHESRQWLDLGWVGFGMGGEVCTPQSIPYLRNIMIWPHGLSYELAAD